MPLCCNLLAETLQVGSHRLQSQNGVRGLGQERQPSHGGPRVDAESVQSGGVP